MVAMFPDTGYSCISLQFNTGEMNTVVEISTGIAIGAVCATLFITMIALAVKVIKLLFTK